MIPFNINLEERISIFSNPTNARKHAQVAILGINHLKDFLPENKEKSFIFNIGILSENYALWNNFRITSGENEYEKVKYEIGQLTLEELKKFWKIKDVKFIHVLTPLSFEGWLGATEGAVYDFACLPNQVFFSRLKVKSKINNLYHVGAKAFPGHGIIGALISSFSLSDLLLNNSLTKGKLLP
jgi:phytoene dehydrogenase-like protein